MAAVLVLAAAPRAQAQTGTLTGRVTDAGNDQPLVGATVRIDGTERGTAADAFGRYVLRGVPTGSSTLVVSFVGFETAREEVIVEAGGETTADFALDEDAAQLSEIVVQSAKFVRNLQETQTSVNVVRAETMEALAVSDWQDASQLVGNFSANGYGGFVIRGISNTGVGFGGEGTTAQLYVDGVAQNLISTRAGARGTWDVEAVEVFRGPQSTVAGRNALAGSVALRTKAPSFEWRAAARLRGGTEETREAALMLTGPIVANQLAFRISGEYQREDPDVTYTSLEPLDLDGLGEAVKNEYGSVKARLLLTPTALPGLSARLNYGYAYDRPNIYMAAMGPDFEARETTAPRAARDWNNAHNASLEARYDLTGALTLTSISGLLANERIYDNLTYENPDPAIIRPVGQNSTANEVDLTQELRLNYDTDRTSAVVGGYAGRFDIDASRTDEGDIFPIVRGLLEQYAGMALPAFEIFYEADNPTERTTVNVAAFGEINYELLPERLTLTGGLRYDHETYESSRSSTAAVSIPNSPFDAATTAQLLQILQQQISEAPANPDATYDVFLPKAGLTVDLTRDASLGATVQRGYRAGGAEVLATGQTNLYDPEYTWNYEASLRTRWLDGRLVANANAFYTDWRDQQVRVPVDGSQITETVNAGESTLYGAEVEVRAMPVRYLTVFGSGGLVHTEFDEFVLEDRDLAGYAFPGSPGETFSLGAAYERATGPFGALSVSYTGPYHNEVNTLPEGGNDPMLRGGDYTVVNGRIGYAFRLQGATTRVALFTRNALDEDIVVQRTYDAYGAPLVKYGMPRVVGLTLGVEL